MLRCPHVDAGVPALPSREATSCSIEGTM